MWQQIASLRQICKCNICQKIGHLLRMCNARTMCKLVTRKLDDDMHQLETTDTEFASSSSESDHLQTIL